MTDFPLTEEEQAQIQLRLHALEIEHHDLDDVIFRLAGDPAQDYFAEGLTEDLTNALSRFKSIGVVASTSAAKHKGSAAPLA